MEISEVKKSIFETNPFLLQEGVRIIDYIAFFGPTEITDYVISEYLAIDEPSLIFAVHSQNLKIFKHFKKNLQNDEKVDNSSLFDSLILESIKCHHNEIMEYIQKNLIKRSKKDDFSKSCIEFYNFLKIQPKSINQSTFFDLANNDYFNLVKLLLNNAKIDINSEDVFKINFSFSYL